MSIGGEPQLVKKEKLIGNNAFGFTVELIQEIFSKLTEELLGVNDELSLTEEDFLKKFPNKPNARQLYLTIKVIKKRNEAILAVSPEEILKSLREIYNVVVDLEKKELNEKDVLLKIKKENPNLIESIHKYYAILRNQEWGYRLGQKALWY